MIVTVPVEKIHHFKFKVDQVLDIRNATAMLREGGLVRLEVINEGGGRGEDAEPATITECSERLGGIIREKKVVWEEIRAQGGIPLEQLIEQKRAQLNGEGTKITEETFAAWKIRKTQKQEKEREKQALSLANKKGMSKRGVKMTGRQLFLANKDLFSDEALAAENEKADVEKNDEDEDEDSGVSFFRIIML